MVMRTRLFITTLVLAINFAPSLPISTAQDRRSVIEEEEEPAAQSPAILRAVSPITALEDARKTSQNPALKRLYHEFALPHDVVISRRGTSWRVLPLKRRFDAENKRSVSFQLLNPNGSGGPRYTLSGNAVLGVSHYEQRVLTKVGDLIKDGLRSEGQAPLSRTEVLQVADLLITEGLRFHLSSRPQEGKESDAWDQFERQLRDGQLNVHREKLSAAAKDESWAETRELASTLARQHRGESSLLKDIEKIYANQANGALKRKEYVTARGLLTEYTNKFRPTDSESFTEIRKNLRTRASELFEESNRLAITDKSGDALKLLSEAEAIDPLLPGLRDRRLLLQKQFPVLRVGCPELPRRISPHLAVTDADHMATRIVFEKLIHLRAAPFSTGGYQYPLGPTRPRIHTDEIRFSLSPHLLWSDGRPLTVKDVVHSVQSSARHSPPSIQPRILIHGPHDFSVKFRQPVLDPYSSLCIPLIPDPGSDSPGSVDSGRPTGSGPYVFHGTDENEAVFIVNPNYRRPHAPDGPSIREVRFVKHVTFEDAAINLSSGRIQILMGYSAHAINSLDGRAGVSIHSQTTMRGKNSSSISFNPRIHMLAPNHRRPRWRNADLRRAVAHALDRESILSNAFGGHEEHDPLAGLFPLGSWAAPHAASSRLHNPELAGGFLKRATEKLGPLPPLTLIYCSDDPQAAAACSEIASLSDRIGVEMTPNGLPLEELIALMSSPVADYDLFYRSFDFQNEYLSLWNLFYPGQEGSPLQRITGFARDGELMSRIEDLMRPGSLSERQTRATQLAIYLAESMPVIPLWQLNSPIAIHNSLRHKELHPTWAINLPESWQLNLVK